MEGIFYRKALKTWLFMMLVFGLLSIAFFIFISIIGSIGEGIGFLLAGVLMCTAAAVGWSFNYRAFIYIDENSIRAKYRWRKKLDLKLKYVEYAAFEKNTLFIEMFGEKLYTVTGLDNAYALCSFIRRNMSFSAVGRPQPMIRQLKKSELAQKKRIGYIWLCGALFFINIIAAATLSGEGSLYRLFKNGWLIAAEVLLIAVMLYLAFNILKNRYIIKRSRYQLQRKIVTLNPMLPGEVLKVYTDDACSCRITVIKSSDSASVYYTVQKFNSDYEFSLEYMSDTYDGLDCLPEGMDKLFDITEEALKWCFKS